MSDERLPFDEVYLRERLSGNPAEWETRLRLADGLFEKESYAEAAEIIWSGRYIPSNDVDLALAIRILSKAQPRKAIRVVTALLEMNQGKAAHNMAMANAMLYHGMFLQAMRFYGAALEIDPTLVNPDIEYMILWSDDKNTLQGMLEKKLPKTGQLRRMVRDPKDGLKLNTRLALHETPICLTDLSVVPGEEFTRDIQESDTPLISVAPPVPISKSAVPTARLHLKWGAPAAKPGDPVASEEAAPPPVSPPAVQETPASSSPGPRKLNIPGR